MTEELNEIYDDEYREKRSEEVLLKKAWYRTFKLADIRSSPLC